jgi:hypothetical protein
MPGFCSYCEPLACTSSKTTQQLIPLFFSCSPIPDLRKNGIAAIFFGAKMLKMRKKLKKTIIFCE